MENAPPRRSAFVVTVGLAGTLAAVGTTWLYRENQFRLEQAKMRSGMELLCATSVVRTLYLSDAARGLQKMLKESVPNGGVEGSFVVLTPEGDQAVRALLADRAPGVPVGTDPKDSERLAGVWSRVASTDPDVARLCGAVVSATQACLPAFSFLSPMSPADKTCIERGVEAPIAALNRYLARNIRLDKKLATPRND